MKIVYILCWLSTLHVIFNANRLLIVCGVASLLCNARSSCMMSGIVSPVEKHGLSQKHADCFLFGPIVVEILLSCVKIFPNITSLVFIRHQFTDGRYWESAHVPKKLLTTLTISHHPFCISAPVKHPAAAHTRFMMSSERLIPPRGASQPCTVLSLRPHLNPRHQNSAHGCFLLGVLTQTCCTLCEP